MFVTPHSIIKLSVFNDFENFGNEPRSIEELLKIRSVLASIIDDYDLISMNSAL